MPRRSATNVRRGSRRAAHPERAGAGARDVGAGRIDDGVREAAAADRRAESPSVAARAATRYFFSVAFSPAAFSAGFSPAVFSAVAAAGAFFSTFFSVV